MRTMKKHWKCSCQVNSLCVVHWLTSYRRNSQRRRQKYKVKWQVSEVLLTGDTMSRCEYCTAARTSESYVLRSALMLTCQLGRFCIVKFGRKSKHAIKYLKGFKMVNFRISILFIFTIYGLPESWILCMLFVRL